MYGEVWGLHHHSQLPGVQALVYFLLCHGYVLSGLQTERERDIIDPAVSYVDWSGETDGLRSTQPKKTANIHSSRPAR